MTKEELLKKCLENDKKIAPSINDDYAKANRRDAIVFCLWFLSDLKIIK